jgi:hypothetical protein
MFGLFTRPPRRPRKMRRSPARPALRVEALETRCNPSGSAGSGLSFLAIASNLAQYNSGSLNAASTTTAAPILINTSASWVDPYDVVIAGTVVDANPQGTVVYVAGSSTAAVLPDQNGFFSTVLKTNGSGPVYLQAQDSAGMYSGAIAFNYSTNTVVMASNMATPVISGVTITLENGVWHIRGQVMNSTPIATVIQITTNIPGQDGRPTVVENADGTFDIGITLDPSSPGGSFSIVAVNEDTGAVSQAWNGYID